MTVDPLAPLLDLVDVRDAVHAARGHVDRALAHRALRRHGGRVTAEVSLRAAVASAALEGRPYELDEVRTGTVTDPVLQGALRVAGALAGLTDRWPVAPRQVLARLHVLAGRGVVPDAELGRPVADAMVAARLDALCAIVAGGSQAPPLVVAAVVHGELLALAPFPQVGGVLARAAARLTLMSRGLDPRGLIPVDVGHEQRQPEYVGAARAFATGTPDGVRSWLKHVAAATQLGATESVRIGDAVLAGG